MWLLYTILSGACVAFLSLCMKIALNHKTDLIFSTTTQTAITGLCFVIVSLFTKRFSFTALSKISMANGFALLLAGIFGAIAALLYFCALQMQFAWKVETVTRVSTIIFLLILSPILLGETIRTCEIIGLVFITAGLYLVAFY